MVPGGDPPQRPTRLAPQSREGWTRSSLVRYAQIMPTTVNIYEAKTHLSKLIERVAAGEEVVISKAGTPVADLVPHRCAPVAFGGLKGQLAYDDDAFTDVDPDIQRMFYGDVDAAA